MFIPLYDDNSTRRSQPFVVYLLILTCSLVWLLQLNSSPDFTLSLAASPLRVIGHGEIATLFTAMFLHGSWLHLIGNMIYLFIFGDQVEDELGHLRFLFFYLTCGILAGLAYVYSEIGSETPSLGASGAIAGVLGAYLVIKPSNNVQVFVVRTVVSMPASLVLGFWFLMQFSGQFGRAESDGIAYMAHLGGFVVGVLLILLMRRRQIPKA